MHLDLLELQVALPAVVRADEGYFLSELRCLAIQQVRWAEQALQESAFFAMCTYFTSFALGTLIAGERLADGALARGNRKLVANSADQEVELVRIGRADVEKLGL